MANAAHLPPMARWLTAALVSSVPASPHHHRRFYGYERLRYISTGFEQLGFEGGGCDASNAKSLHPIAALRKPAGDASLVPTMEG